MAKDRIPSSSQERNELIIRMLESRGSIKVSELQEILGVSDMTVRRCLNEMANDGLIKRVHGGAMALDVNENSHAFMERRTQSNSEIKEMLAKKAIQIAADATSVFLDAGTTCFCIAKELAASGRKLMVITDSIRVLQELQNAHAIDCMILGGGLADDLTTVEGPLTIETASKIHVDVCIFSADGFNDEQIENQYLNGALTKKIMIQRAGRSLFVADSSKCNKKRCFSFCGWDEVDAFLSDSNLPGAIRACIASKGVETHLVEL